MAPPPQRQLPRSPDDRELSRGGRCPLIIGGPSRWASACEKINLDWLGSYPLNRWDTFAERFVSESCAAPTYHRLIPAICIYFFALHYCCPLLAVKSSSEKAWTDSDLGYAECFRHQGMGDSDCCGWNLSMELRKTSDGCKSLGKCIKQSNASRSVSSLISHSRTAN
eukprot:1968522-Amphidinium_carterae.2